MVTITNFEKKEYTFKPEKEKEIIQNIEKQDVNINWHPVFLL